MISVFQKSNCIAIDMLLVTVRHFLTMRRSQFFFLLTPTVHAVEEAKHFLDLLVFFHFYMDKKISKPSVARSAHENLRTFFCSDAQSISFDIIDRERCESKAASEDGR